MSLKSNFHIFRTNYILGDLPTYVNFFKIIYKFEDIRV